jgi:hypothetical protein
MAETRTASETGSKVQATKEEAVDRAHDLSSSTAKHAAAVKNEAKDKAVTVARDVRQELETQGDVQAKRVASALHDVGGQLQSMAESGQPGAVTDLTRQVADKSRQFASRLEDGGVEGVSDDLRHFARRQPGVFLAAAGVAGFVVTRLLRNASQLGTDSAPSSEPSSAGQLPSGIPE